jgi:hypothetical protein
MKPDHQLEHEIHDLADALTSSAASEEVVTAELERRLAVSGRRRLLGTMALALVVVAAVAVGVTALGQPQLGGPAPLPEVAGVYVTDAPDAAGQCRAVRLYDTTPADGRVAIWAWTGNADCSERSDNLSTGLGHAEGVRLASGAGVAVYAVGEAGASPRPSDLVLVLDPGGEGGASMVAYPSVQAAVAGDDGIPVRLVAELDITYRPN